MICPLGCTNRQGGRCVVLLSSCGCRVHLPRLWVWQPLPSLSSAAWEHLIIQFSSGLWQPVGSQFFVWGHQPVMSREEEGLDLLQCGFVCFCFFPRRFVVVEHSPSLRITLRSPALGIVRAVCTSWCLHTGYVSIV